MAAVEPLLRRLPRVYDPAGMDGSEILAGARTVVALDVIERIAEGLHMPDHARITLGIAPQRDDVPGGPAEYFGELIRVFPNQASAAPDIRTHAASARDR